MWIGRWGEGEGEGAAVVLTGGFVLTFWWVGRCGARWGALAGFGVCGVGFVLRRRDALGVGLRAARFGSCGFRVIALRVECGGDGLRRNSVERALPSPTGNVHLWCTAKLGDAGKARVGRAWARGLRRRVLEAPMMIFPFLLV
jgi:hypothetical protein